MPIAIFPEKYFESHGAYSGSAIEINGKLNLVYTGNSRDKNWNRSVSQCLAIMDTNYKIEKLGKPIIKEVPKEYTEHFRDPKIWKEDDFFYMVIGAQRKADKKGTLVLYKGKSLLSLELLGEIVHNLGDFGYMFECPDYFELNNKGVLLFSPQGLKSEKNRYNNIYQSGYIIGDKLNLKTLELEKHSDFIEIDNGFDFYAPQTFKKNLSRIMIGWMGLPEIEYPTDKMGWAHCLTIPRELSFINNKLYQLPAKQLEKLRKNKVTLNGSVNNEINKLNIHGDVYELNINFSNKNINHFGLNLRVGKKEKTSLVFSNKTFIFDRSFSGVKFAEDFGQVRKCKLLELKNIRIFVDRSSVEVFINNGEEVFSGRIFPEKKSTGIEVFSDELINYKIEKYEL